MNAPMPSNDCVVSSIPVGTTGAALIQLNPSLSIVAPPYTLNIADTYRDINFASALFILKAVEG